MLPPASQRVKRRGSHALVGPARLRLRGTSLKRLEYPISHRYPTFTTARRNEPPVAGVMERRGHEADPTPPRRTEVGRRSWHWADECPGHSAARWMENANGQRAVLLDSHGGGRGVESRRRHRLGRGRR